MRTIVSKFVAGAILVTSATAMTVPASARYDHRDGYYDARYGEYYEGRRDYRRDRGYRDYRNDRRDRGYYRGQRCDRGTGGLIIGAIAGGLLGNEVVGRRGDKTAGAIIGAGVGALAGRAIDRSDGRRC
jgi:Glycine zipper 2TM domain